MVIVAVAVLMWVGTATADPQVSLVTGGTLQSPDGRWTITARPDTDAVWLQGPGVRRKLMRANRGVTVLWITRIGRVVLIERTIHRERIAVFTLAKYDRTPPDRLERQIEGDLRRKGPPLQGVENRSIVFGHRGGQRCAIVTETGLPLGKRVGPFLRRQASYRINFVQGTALRSLHCARRTRK